MEKCNYVFFIIVIAGAVRSCLSDVIGVCDGDIYQICQRKFSSFAIKESSIHLDIIHATDNFVENIQNINYAIGNRSDVVIIAFGGNVAVNSATTVADTLRLPIITYDLSTQAALVGC